MVHSRIAALSPTQRRLVASALRRVVAMRLALLVRSLDSLHRGIERSGQRTQADFTAQEAACAVRAVARRVPGTHCLARSLALHALLRDAGFDSELRIGVARDGAGIAAHAWVECTGEPVGDASDIASRYAAFDGPVPLQAFGR